MAFHPQEGSFRMLAKALLGAFLFLLVASFLVLPCLTSDSGLFGAVAGAHSCQEHKLFQAQADLSKLEFLPAEAVFRFAVVPPALFALFAAAVVVFAALSRPPGRTPVRSGTLPFVSSDPPRLPAFGALRDA